MAKIKREKTNTTIRFVGKNKKNLAKLNKMCAQLKRSQSYIMNELIEKTEILSGI